jgi:PAS domain-containing protein
MHSLLQRQLRRQGIDPDTLPPNWEAVARAVGEAYDAFDADRAMRERSLELSSSELLAANHDLRSAGELLRATLESTADGILAVDGEGRVIHANDQFLAFWDVPAELAATNDARAMMKHLLARLEHPERAIVRLQQVLASSEAALDTLTFADGRVFECYSRPLMGPKGIDGRVFTIGMYGTPAGRTR